MILIILAGRTATLNIYIYRPVGSFWCHRGLSPSAADKLQCYRNSLCVYGYCRAQPVCPPCFKRFPRPQKKKRFLKNNFFSIIRVFMKYEQNAAILNRFYNCRGYTVIVSTRVEMRNSKIYYHHQHYHHHTKKHKDSR